MKPSDIEKKYYKYLKEKYNNKPFILPYGCLPRPKCFSYNIRGELR